MKTARILLPAAVSLGALGGYWLFAGAHQQAAPKAEAQARPLKRPVSKAVGDPSDARRNAVSALFEIENIALRSKAVLDTFAEELTPPSEDPTFSMAVERMAQIWESPARVQQGQELMLLESRPRARRLMAIAMARVAQSRAAKAYSEERRHALATDLIDVYFEPESESYRAELVPGIESVSGEDVSRVLLRGAANLKEGELGIIAREKKAMQEAVQKLAEGPE